MYVLGLLIISFVWLETKGQECPALYQRYSQHHTFCAPPNASCQIVSDNLDPSLIDVILSAHNKHRSEVATGAITQYSLPSASNMLQLVWDNELAAVAQKHASQCLFDHDCQTCSEVQNFEVGQNLGIMQDIRDESEKPDWVRIVDGWYNEVQLFDANELSSYAFHHETGHFTQLVWANSWRVGCGYAMYKAGQGYEQLYTCDYGPAGNVREHIIYKSGEPCSECPINSCCGKSCSNGYDGLCQISGDNAPQYPPPVGSLFFCSFNGEPDCDTETSDPDKWIVSHTLSGSYIGIVLNGGESSTISFKKPFKGQDSMCFILNYRKGPQVDGQESASTAKAILAGVDGNTNDMDLQEDSATFMQTSIGFPWGTETKVSFSFSVPEGKPPQYLEIKDIHVTEGQC